MPKPLQAGRQQIWQNHQVPCNQYLPAYIVLCEPWGDLHRHAIFLSPSYGLLSAFLYGAVSKRNVLRATVQSFSFGQLNLKQGKSRSMQISDWQLEAPNLLLSPPKCSAIYQHTALWSELLLYSHGLGQTQAQAPAQSATAEQSLLFTELRSLFSSILHFASPEHCLLATLRFFWQFLLLEGFHPGLSQCHNCEQSFTLLGDQALFFSKRSELLCQRCARARSGQQLNETQLNLLCWAEQDFSSFSRQDEFFFGAQALHYSQVAQPIFFVLQRAIQHLLGRQLRCAIDV